MKSFWWQNNLNLNRPTPSRLTLNRLLLKNHQSHKSQVNHSKNNRVKKNRIKNNHSKMTFCKRSLNKREPNSLKPLKSKAIPNKNQTYLNRMLLKLNRMTMLFDSLLMYMISFTREVNYKWIIVWILSYAKEKIFWMTFLCLLKLRLFCWTTWFFLLSSLCFHDFLVNKHLIFEF